MDDAEGFQSPFAGRVTDFAIDNKIANCTLPILTSGRRIKDALNLFFGRLAEFLSCGSSELRDLAVARAVTLVLLRPRALQYPANDVGNGAVVFCKHDKPCRQIAGAHMEIAAFDDPAEQLRPFTGGLGGTLAIEGLSLFRNTGRRSRCDQCLKRRIKLEFNLGVLNNDLAQTGLCLPMPASRPADRVADGIAARVTTNKARDERAGTLELGKITCPDRRLSEAPVQMQLSCRCRSSIARRT